MKVRKLLLISICIFLSCKSNKEKVVELTVSQKDTVTQDKQIKKEILIDSNKTLSNKKKSTTRKKTFVKKENKILINSKDERLKVVFNDTIYYKRNIEDKGGWRWCPEDKPNMGLYFDSKKKTWYAIRNGKDEIVPDLGRPCRTDQNSKN